MPDAWFPALEHTYAAAVPALSVPWRAAPAPAPRIVVLNADLALDLGLDPEALATPAGVEFLLGRVPDDVPTYAQAYAGHQFGSYSPRLGDGRALLVGEVRDAAGRRWDVHVKGSGSTPFSRGDGRAVLGPMLREYLLGEAMHALGIPTTRALAVVATGEQVLRDRPLPGAVLCRVAASHLRVGTVQYAAALPDPAVLPALVDYVIARHHPRAADAARPALDLLERVSTAQARLVAAWMAVGFVHGVLNTDNTTLSGETIDYGPCAFVDTAHPGAVFSSIDHGGRYAYGNQPAVTVWNLARLAEALLPLIDAEPSAAVRAATDVLDGFAGAYREALQRAMAAKLGVPAGAPETTGLVGDALDLLATPGVDHARFFRALAGGTAGELFADPRPFEAWSARRAAVLPDDADARGGIAAAMNGVNPLYVPRNHLVEAALDAATAGDLAPFHRLLAALTRPFDERAGWADLTEPRPPDAPPHVTFCGT